MTDDRKEERRAAIHRCEDRLRRLKDERGNLNTRIFEQEQIVKEIKALFEQDYKEQA